jgi:hypothetical protein
MLQMKAFLPVMLLAGCHPALVPATAGGSVPEQVVALDLVTGHQADIVSFCVSVVSEVDGGEASTPVSIGLVSALARQSAAQFHTGSACRPEDAELLVGPVTQEAAGGVRVKGGVTCGPLCGWGFTALLLYQYQQHRWIIVRREGNWRS